MHNNLLIVISITNDTLSNMSNEEKYYQKLKGSTQGIHANGRSYIIYQM